jgi:hypothetical protein
MSKSAYACALFTLAVTMFLALSVPSTAEDRTTIPKLLKENYRIVNVSAAACKDRDKERTCFFFLLEKDRDYYLCNRTFDVTAAESPCAHVE